MLLTTLSTAVYIAVFPNLTKWVINTNSLSSLQSIEFNRENNSILYPIYNILQTHKHITLCMVPVHMGIKSNKAGDKKGQKKQ